MRESRQGRLNGRGETRRSELDFLACYIAPKHVWFIFPVSFVPKRNYLTIRDTAASWITRYRQRWAQFQSRSDE